MNERSNATPGQKAVRTRVPRAVSESVNAEIIRIGQTNQIVLALSECGIDDPGDSAAYRNLVNVVHRVFLEANRNQRGA